MALSRRSIFTAIGLSPVVALTAAAPAAAGASRNRISCETGDPGELLYAKLCSDGMIARVYLDGVEQEDCVTADPGLGLVKRAVRTDKGNIAINHVTSEIMYEEVHGVVRWEAAAQHYGVKKARDAAGAVRVLPVV